jgi:hypothetical protein
MFGVVITVDDELNYDLKIFEKYADACGWFENFERHVGKGGYRSISMYDVPDAANVHEAAAAIEAGDNDRALLLRIKKTGDDWVQH